MAAASLSQAPGGGRGGALNAFRGMVIAAMLVVNNVVWTETTPRQLMHASWNQGVTFTNMIFPWFLLAMGTAIPFSATARSAKGIVGAAYSLSAARRATVLVALGLLVVVSILVKVQIRQAWQHPSGWRLVPLERALLDALGTRFGSPAGGLHGRVYHMLVAGAAVPLPPADLHTGVDAEASEGESNSCWRHSSSVSRTMSNSSRTGSPMARSRSSRTGGTSTRLFATPAKTCERALRRWSALRWPSRYAWGAPGSS